MSCFLLIRQSPSATGFRELTHMMKPIYRQHAAHKGSALIIALIMLLLLTILGIQGMRTNVLQERMAGNVRERNLAFQASEAALRAGETEGPFSPSNTPLAGAAEWDGAGASGALLNFDVSLIEDPVYHVGPPQYVRVGLAVPPEWRYLYPVTSRGAGGQASTVVLLQSSFEPSE